MVGCGRKGFLCILTLAFFLISSPCGRFYHSPLFNLTYQKLLWKNEEIRLIGLTHLFPIFDIKPFFQETTINKIVRLTASLFRAGMRPEIGLACGSNSGNKWRADLTCNSQINLLQLTILKVELNMLVNLKITAWIKKGIWRIKVFCSIKKSINNIFVYFYSK